ncbi:arylsulfatase [Cupriavidus sp. AcVe19-1a]|nr:arylsulfatase [Cupriavidus sp. AcVe19-1a]
MLLIVATVFGQGAVLAATKPNTAMAPNIIVIVADDMGFNDIEPFGQMTIKTPALNMLANDGVRFTNFHVHATCSPTRAQLLTGVDNHLAGMGAMEGFKSPGMDKYPGSYIGAINDRVETFAETLKDNGYATFMAGKWHLGAKNEYLPPAKGFERSFVMVDGGGSHWDDVGLTERSPRTKFSEDGKPAARDHGKFSSDLYTDRFLSYMKAAQSQGKPFLGYLAFQAVHDPLHAPADYIEKYRGKFAEGYDEHRQKLFANMAHLGVIPRATKMSVPAPLFKPWAQLTAEERNEQERLMEIYAAMLDNLDANIGRVVAELKRSGAYDNTVIFFFSDNGPSAAYMGFYRGNKDGKWIKNNFDTSLKNMGAPKSFVGIGPGWAYASSAPFKLFKSFGTEGGTISPMIVKAPKVNKPGSINDSFLAVEDIFPTVLEFSNAERGSTRNGLSLAPLKGKSFVSVINGRAKSVRDANFERGEELFGNKVYRQGKWKISWLPKPFGEERWQLFDTDSDRGETHDLAEKYPKLVTSMAEKYEKWAKENNVVDWDYEYLVETIFNHFDWRKGMPAQIVNRD